MVDNQDDNVQAAVAMLAVLTVEMEGNPGLWCNTRAAAPLQLYKLGPKAECAEDITTSDFVGLSKNLWLVAAKISRPKFRGKVRKFS
jgi:hypothetical protein